MQLWHQYRQGPEIKARKARIGLQKIDRRKTELEPGNGRGKEGAKDGMHDHDYISSRRVLKMHLQDFFIKLYSMKLESQKPAKHLVE